MTWHEDIFFLGSKDRKHSTNSTAKLALTSKKKMKEDTKWQNLSREDRLRPGPLALAGKLQCKSPWLHTILKYISLDVLPSWDATCYSVVRVPNPSLQKQVRRGTCLLQPLQQSSPTTANTLSGLHCFAIEQIKKSRYSSGSRER